ncbi:MAG: hypothetical protein QMD04_08915 [Anaerolineales bacterium]|nr:hypothetical protein [Anaerolineales bacterium]
MSRTDRFAILVALAAILAAYLTAAQVFELIPHIEDEMAFVWQAQVYARGELTVPSPAHPKNLMTPFVVDYHRVGASQGQRFAKYPPGWPVVLAFGYLLGGRAWVNPLLAGLAVWLTYRLGQKVFTPAVGLLAAFLTLVSPLFLMLSGSLLSHTWSLVLSLTLTLAWLDTFVYKTRLPRGLTALVAALTLGLLALTRPLTAVGVALLFFLHALFLLWRGGWDVRRLVLFVGAVSLLVSALFLLWQYALTGNPFTNPYTLWWSYDSVGFGPAVGRQDGGHNLFWGWITLKHALTTGWRDFFGWGNFSWLFLPFGLWAARRNRPAWLIGSVFASLAGAYLLYWAGSTTFGPRYYFEGFQSITLLSAAGCLGLAGWSKTKGWKNSRFIGVGALLLFLVGYNLFSYLPTRLQEMRGLYGVERADLLPFLTPEARALTPAIVVVHIQETWTDYGALLDLQDPWLTSPFIFALGQSEALRADYPDRRLIHYYPDESYTFYMYTTPSR